MDTLGSPTHKQLLRGMWPHKIRCSCFIWSIGCWYSEGGLPLIIVMKRIWQGGGKEARCDELTWNQPRASGLNSDMLPIKPLPLHTDSCVMFRLPITQETTFTPMELTRCHPYPNLTQCLSLVAECHNKDWHSEETGQYKLAMWDVRC